MEVGMVQLEGRTPLQPHLIGTGMVNEKKIKVVFDSGAWRSTLTRDFAQRVGIKPEDESVKAAGNASGLGKRRVESWIARFDSMDIGGERVRNPRLRISDIRMAGDGDMLLGADFFLSHRIYVAAQQNKIYFTYNGGPVFDLRESPVIANNKSDVARQADSIDGETSGNNKSDNTLTPAELRRRGAAFAGRGQLKEALADLDLAVKIDKDDPQNYYQRGEIHWRNNEPDLALEDINTVLRIQPDNVAALVLRGELLLFKKDKTGATQDFIAASSLSHDDASTELSIAESYGRAHEYNDLIKHLDNWAAKNKKDERMQQVLNMRCHARLMLRTQLDMALADCSKAIDLGSPYAGIYNNRGLVYLQQSNLDKAMKDFQKALKLQPKDALALYALGIVERGKGNKAQAEKDIGSALTIAPHIDQLFKQTGIGVQ
ncbi:MAG TPA: tetratricopeptide repeat protein [Steroidobacteraceae bacterium]|nr:tetratricopeptide repeat protein [Steroidobacteraceae bacterium]